MSIGQINAPDIAPLLSPAAGSAAGCAPAASAAVQNSLPAVTSASTLQDTLPAGNAETESQILQQSVSSLNAHMKNVGSNSVEFSINSSTGQVVVQVVDTQTQTILMQTPSKQAIAIAQAQLQAQDNPRGLLIKTQA
ncbi:MAG TPA: flagellar protein FlaG [Burkholderiales bacterium]|nr:flagellar protein FlaG [Burkholderiales bacterium]